MPHTHPHKHDQDATKTGAKPGTVTKEQDGGTKVEPANPTPPASEPVPTPPLPGVLDTPNPDP